MADFTYVCNDFLKIYACRWRVVKMSLKRGPKRVQNVPKMGPKSSQKWSRQGFRTSAPYFQIRGPILGPFWDPKSLKNVKNAIPKIMKKTTTKKHGNLCRKGAKIEPKSMQKHIQNRCKNRCGKNIENDDKMDRK